MAETPHWSNCTDRLHEVMNARRVGIISDFDGTLANFTLDPLATVITPENAAALDTLLGHVALIALVSGRPSGDLRSRFTRPWLVYHGSHGMEYWNGQSQQLHDEALPWEAPLQRLLADFGTPTEPGILIENKRVTASVHYRQAPDPGATRLRLLEALQPLADKYGFKLSEGRWIWEIKPPISLSKGTAVLKLIADHYLDGAIFLGDDITDLPAFKVVRELTASGKINGVAIGVLQPDGTGPAEVRASCDMLANSPDDVAKCLQYLATLK